MRGLRRLAACAMAGLAVGSVLTGCSGGDTAETANSSPGVTEAAATSPSPSVTQIGSATAAPDWLGTRVLPTQSNGYAAAQDTPAELRNRSIITVDALAPPADGQFHSTVQAVPDEVLARSTWSADCPVSSAELSYLTVGFVGFDGLAHTGELLVNASAAEDIVTVFQRLFDAGFPIEQMTITDPSEATAGPTGDSNDVESFVCRAVRGATSWSQHSYGLAVDINPFQNPYHKGEVVLPELATSYLDRDNARAGMVFSDDVVLQAFTSIGWKWGGDYTSLKDYMHFSATGG